MAKLDALIQNQDEVLRTIGAALDLDSFLEGESQVLASIEALRITAAEGPAPIEYVEYAGVGVKGQKMRKSGEAFSVAPFDVANFWSIPEDFGRYLYRLCRLLKPERVLEIGTCIGVSGLYILCGCAHGGQDLKFITLEGSPQLADMARKNFDAHGFPDALVRRGVHAETLPDALKELEVVDFAYVDGSHLYREVLDQHALLLGAVAETAIIFHDDIRWSVGMMRAWREMLRAEADVAAVIDLVRAGIFLVKRGHRGPPALIEPFK